MLPESGRRRQWHWFGRRAPPSVPPAGLAPGERPAGSVLSAGRV